MQFISKYSKRVWFVTDVLSKYAWFIHLKDKEDITISNAFQKILDVSRAGINSENKHLLEDIQKSVIRKVRKRKVYSSFKDKIWVADLADMQFISKYNKIIRFLFCYWCF